MTQLIDNRYMYRAVYLANHCKVETSPNPTVGAVLVANDKIIGEGYTQEDGSDHAEVMAIKNVSKANKSKIKGATLYVTLEPCSVFGRTPPCCDLIIKEKIAKVYVGTIDLSPGVIGKGLENLRKAGIEVHVGLLQNQAIETYKYRRAFIKNQRPFIILKQAVSADGYIGSEKTQVPITGKMSQFVSHQLRANVDAILVGTNTVLTDNPSLTTRVSTGRSPIAVLLDSHGKLSLESNVFKQGQRQVLLVVSHDILGSKLAEVKRKNLKHVSVLGLKKESLLEDLMPILVERRIGRVLVEGGAKTIQSFVEKGFYDEYLEWNSNTPLAAYSHKIKATVVPGRLISRKKYNNDELSIFKAPVRGL